jgi:hypothetical protein
MASKLIRWIRHVRGWAVRRSGRILGRACAAAAIAVAAAACSSGSSDFTTPNILPRIETFTKNTLEYGSAAKPVSVARTLTAADFINPDAQCPAPNPTAVGPDGQPAPALGGIALDMSECDVVRRAGQPDQFEIGTTERGERAVTMTYLAGPRPGIYRFAGGRLHSIERGPQPAAPEKPAKKPAAKKPPPA